MYPRAPCIVDLNPRKEREHSALAPGTTSSAVNSTRTHADADSESVHVTTTGSQPLRASHIMDSGSQDEPEQWTLTPGPSSLGVDMHETSTDAGSLHVSTAEHSST
ncbi:hypothetical protein Hypma_003751 [Hypsizygus marmoreus]|uniref:Uncharacterized protein n=1 Tax=Hypsizygus marmoreus TaxID=39966 RepID=A0A369J3Y7_HYPMA|nr:hypothetical protein Hypma_003751 [Hypsizygus marmoreus]